MSPFTKHRDKVLGQYSTASWLRSVVLAMWNGTGYPVGLSRVASLDADHYAAFSEMLESYRDNGEDDPAFMALADEARAMVEREAAANDRYEALEDWLKDVKRSLREIGQKSHEAENYYEWFAKRFDDGKAPSDAAKEFSER